MSTITMGFRPIPLEILLSRGSDFVSALVADEPWPAGTQIVLLFTASRTADPFEHPADIDGARASWRIPAAEVGQILDADARYVRLRYTDPDGNVLPWARGQVNDA